MILSRNSGKQFERQIKLKLCLTTKNLRYALGKKSFLFSQKQTNGRSNHKQKQTCIGQKCLVRLEPRANSMKLLNSLKSCIAENCADL